jgi:hypothetical protein
MVAIESVFKPQIAMLPSGRRSAVYSLKFHQLFSRSGWRLLGRPARAAVSLRPVVFRDMLWNLDAGDRNDGVPAGSG